jgi:hypothetical protein
MKTYKITEEQAQQILNYISATPTGNIPFGEAYKIAQILMNLEEIKEQKNGNSK